MKTISDVLAAVVAGELSEEQAALAISQIQPAGNSADVEFHAVAFKPDAKTTVPMVELRGRGKPRTIPAGVWQAVLDNADALKTAIDAAMAGQFDSEFGDGAKLATTKSGKRRAK